MGCCGALRAIHRPDRVVAVVPRIDGPDSALRAAKADYVVVLEQTDVTRGRSRVARAGVLCACEGAGSWRIGGDVSIVYAESIEQMVGVVEREQIPEHHRILGVVRNLVDHGEALELAAAAELDPRRYWVAGVGERWVWRFGVVSVLRETL